MLDIIEPAVNLPRKLMTGPCQKGEIALITSPLTHRGF